MRNTTACLAAIAVATVLVAGCGGNDFHASPPATESVPASASASIDGFIAYLKALIASTGTDMLEPVDTAAVTPPPADETSEPQTID
jgi:hypothetical protein